LAFGAFIFGVIVGQAVGDFSFFAGGGIEGVVGVFAGIAVDGGKRLSPVVGGASINQGQITVSGNQSISFDMLTLDTGGSVGVGLETLVESGCGSLGSALGSDVVENEPGYTF